MAFSLACGSPSSTAPAAEPAAGPAAAPATPAAPTLAVVEPADGSSSGHVARFSWTPVDGADGYRLHLTAVVDGRTIWDSDVLTATEVELPNTVALEPESYAWQVTALQGTTVLAQSPVSRFMVTP